MPSVSAPADFAAAVHAAHLLTEAQAARLTPAALAKFPSAEALARQLIKLGWITAFQAKMLLEGDGAQLAFGKYRLLDKLGEGGMGLVYKAQDTKLGRLVALKVIRADYLNHPQALKRFDREAKAAAALSHPHIVTLYDADEIAGTRYLAMEYVAGADLGKALKAEGKLPLAQACGYVRQAALGLAHAHAAGLVHRDIKPANLLLAQAPSGGGGSTPSHAAWGQVKVSDLGLARLHVANDSGATKDGALIGTIDYMAPEQARDASSVDARADLYSLGCTLFHLLTGRPPFAGETAINKMLAHQQDPPPRLRDLAPEAPEGLEKLLDALMAKDPNARPKDGAAVAEALEPFCRSDPKSASEAQLPTTRRLFQQAAGEQADTESHEPLQRTASQVARPHRMRPHWLLIGAGGLAVCLFAFLAVYNNATVLQRYASVPVFGRSAPLAASTSASSLPAPSSADARPSLPVALAPGPDGWTPIWNGHDLTGWNLVVVEPVDGKFEIVVQGGDRLLRLPPGTVGTLTVLGPYRNFTLRLEYRLGEAPATGPGRPPLLKFFCLGDPADKPLGILPGFPIALGGLKRGKVDGQPSDAHLRAQTMEDREAPPLKPPHEWNVLELRTKGAAASTFLNGQLVWSGLNLRARLLGQETPLSAGKLQLVAEGQEALIRKITLKPSP